MKTPNLQLNLVKMINQNCMVAFMVNMYSTLCTKDVLKLKYLDDNKDWEFPKHYIPWFCGVASISFILYHLIDYDSLLCFLYFTHIIPSLRLC
jgi:hypothetical protein